MCAVSLTTYCVNGIYSVFNCMSSKRVKIKEDISVPKPNTSAAATSAVKDKVRTFWEDWLCNFDWLIYDSQRKLMTCGFLHGEATFPAKQIL